MRWIFRYNEQAAKYLGKLTHTKIKPEPQPWLHVAVKTMSARNPWAGYVIYVWDTREVVGEYRSNKGLFTTEQFKLANCGMQRAVDNREPLVGGRKDINEFFEFGKFDASHSDVFGEDGKRVTKTPLYTKRAKKAGLESTTFSIDAGATIDRLLNSGMRRFVMQVYPDGSKSRSYFIADSKGIVHAVSIHDDEPEFANSIKLGDHINIKAFLGGECAFNVDNADDAGLESKYTAADFGKAGSPLMFYSNIQQVKRELAKLQKSTNKTSAILQKIKFLQNVIDNYADECLDVDFATEAQLDIKPGQRVVVQNFNLDKDNELAPEKPKAGTLQKIATYGEVCDNNWFKHAENAMSLDGTRRATLLYLVDGIWYKPYRHKYGACVIKAANESLDFATESRRTFVRPDRLKKGDILTLDGYDEGEYRYEGIYSRKYDDIKKYDKTHVCEDAMDAGFKGPFVVVTALDDDFCFADGSKTGAMPYGANGVVLEATESQQMYGVIVADEAN